LQSKWKKAWQLENSGIGGASANWKFGWAQKTGANRARSRFSQICRAIYVPNSKSLLLFLSLVKQSKAAAILSSFAILTR